MYTSCFLSLSQFNEFRASLEHPCMLPNSKLLNCSQMWVPKLSKGRHLHRIGGILHFKLSA